MSDSSPARARRRRLLRLLAALTSSVLALVTGEVVVRLVAPQENRYAGIALFQDDPYCGYRLRPNLQVGDLTINSAGLRDVERPLAKPPGTRRIVVLGDSFTYAAVPLEQNFCRGLARELGPGVDVVNAGVPAWNTIQEAGWLEHYGLAYDPDAVVVAFFVGNDVWENRGGDAYQVVGNELTRNLHPDQGPSLLRRALMRSHLYRVAHRLPEEVFWRLRGDSIARRRYQKIEHARMGVCARGEQAQASWEPGWEVTRTQLQRIRDLIAPRPVVLLVIPDEFQVDPALRQAVCARYGQRLEDYDWDGPQRRLARIARELGLEEADALEPCRDATAQGTALYLPLDSHWNQAGNALAARLLAHAPPLEHLARRAP